MQLTSTQALIYNQYGPAQEVLKLTELAMPAVPPPGQVRLKMLLSPIHPSDHGLIAGTYGRLHPLPAVGGREGVGEVIALGEGLPSDWLGKRCAILTDCGTWRTYVDVESAVCFPVPAAMKLEEAAMALINPPTALKLLEDFVELKPGDWIIQNAGNSAVGQWIVQLAKRRGIHTISAVREDHGKALLESLGADVVLRDEKGYGAWATEVAGGTPIRLALNSIGGQSVIELIQALGNGGTCVTFGAGSKDLVRWPTRELIFNHLILRGFWFENWFLLADLKKRLAFFENLFLNSLHWGLMTALCGTYPIADYSTALKESLRPGRCGKVLIRVS